MSLGLPDGWLDTGVNSGSVSLTGSLAVLQFSGAIGHIGEWEVIGFAGINGASSLCPQSAGIAFEAGYQIIGPTQTSTTITYFECPPLIDSQLDPDWRPTYTPSISPPQSFLATIGPYRLGRKRVLDPDISDMPEPVFDQLHYVEQYRWFADENTSLVTACGGLIEPPRWMQSSGMWGDTQASAFTPIDVGLTIGGLAFAGTVGNQPSSVTQVEWTGLTAGGNGDTSGLDTGCLLSSGGGNVIANTRNGSVSTSAVIYPSTRFHYRIQPSFFYRDPGDRQDASVRVMDNWLTTGGGTHLPYEASIQCPHDVAYVIPNRFGWTHPTLKPPPHTLGPLSITDYVPANWEEHPENDRTLCLWCVPGNAGPTEWPKFFQPVEITFAEELPILTGTPEWVSNDPDLTVTGDNVFETPPGGVPDTSFVRREIGEAGTNLPIWRRWLGVGTLGHSDPLFNPDQSHTTKHGEDDDVWFWGHYRYLRFHGTAEGPRTLRLRVEGVYLSIDDPHTTGSDRLDNFSVTETPYAVEYDLVLDVPEEGGDFDDLLDLCFPVELAGAATELPFYHGRVDVLELYDFGPGETELNLALKADGPVYLKSGYSSPAQRFDYSNLGVSNAGSYGMGVLGDESYKAPETGDSPLSGGNIRYVRPLTGTVSGLILDEQYGLGTFIHWLNVQEGFTAVINETALDEANEDAYGVSLGSPSAQCLVPTVPDVEFEAGETFKPDCVWLCNRVQITNAVPYVIGTYQCVGGAVEAIIVERAGDEVVPAQSSVRVRAVGYPESAQLCDESGYVRAYPVPASASVSLELVPET